MRYIHDGKLRNRTVEPPKTFVASEPVTCARGQPDFGKLLNKIRRAETPLLISHEEDARRWRWTDE